MIDSVVVIEPMGFGGLTHYAYCLCEALTAKGTKTSLITAKNYELAARPREFRLHPILPEWFRPEGSPAALQVVPRESPLAVLRRRLRSAWTMLRIVLTVFQERASVVHIQWPVGPHDWLYVTCLRLARRRIVYTAHDILPHEHGPEDVVRLARLLRHVDCVILHSRENEAQFRRVFGHIAPPLYVVPHGNYSIFPESASVSREDARVAIGVPHKAQVVLFFGAIRPYKGLHDLIGAFGRVRAMVPTAWLVIAGYPFEDFAPYERAIAEAEIKECTTLHLGYHPVAGVAKFFSAADVIVLPYRSASQSGVAQLAFAFGTPVIATRVGGLPEVVKDQRTGLLVSPGDERGLAEAIIRLLEDAPLRRSMAVSAGRRAAAGYSWNLVADKTCRIYDDTVGSHRAPALVSE